MQVNQLRTYIHYNIYMHWLAIYLPADQCMDICMSLCTTEWKYCRYIQNALDIFMHLWTTYFIIVHIHIVTDAVPSSVASFNDSRCVAGGVCSNDPLLFTCELHEIIVLRVNISSGSHEHISLRDTAADVALPAGFTAVSLNISEITINTRDFFLTLSIANASLLNGGVIICDDTTPRNRVTAGCLVHGRCRRRIDLCLLMSFIYTLEITMSYTKSVILSCMRF